MALPQMQDRWRVHDEIQYIRSSYLIDKSPTLIVVAEVSPLNEVIGLGMRIQYFAWVGENGGSGITLLNDSELLCRVAVAILLQDAGTVTSRVGRNRHT